MAKARTISGLTWLTGLIGLVLAACLAYLAVRVIITAINPETAWKQPAIGVAPAGQAGARSQQAFNFTTDPFNRDVARTELVEEVEIGQDAPETTLNLTLTGLITGPNGNANLRTPDGKELGYRIGDEIINGVELQAINKDYIVIAVDGQLQRLTFARDKESLLGRKQAAAPVQPQTVAASPKNKTGGASGTASMFQNISLKRVIKDGKLAGYSVRPNRPGVKLSQYGFENGDIVTEIAGTSVTKGRPDFVGLLAKAQSQGGVDIAILRDGQKQVIRLGAP